MALLVDHEIVAAVARGDLVIDPFGTSNLGPNSYDVTLAPTLRVYDEVILDMRIRPRVRDIAIDPGEGLVLSPGRVYLGSTVEVVGSHRGCVPRLDGRSSHGRLGIQVHLTAGLGDVGFVGRWTLEIIVTHPVRVYPGVRIAQFVFERIAQQPSRLYAGKYQGQDGAVESLIRLDRELRR